MPSVKKNFIYSSVLTSANYIFPLIVYPYISRVLGVTNIGICKFVDSIISYFILFSMFGVTSIGIREIAKSKNNKEKMNEVFNSLFWINALFTLISTTFLVFAIFLVPSLTPYRKLLFIGVVKVLSNFFLIEWFFKGLEDFRYITIRTLIVKCLYVISIFIFVRDDTDYIKYYLLTASMIMLNSILNETYAHRFIKIRISGVKVFTYLSPLLIMGAYTLMTSMYTTFNVAYLGFVSEPKEVGYYTTSHHLYDALLAFFTTLTGVMLPRMSSLISEGRFDEFTRLLMKSANVLFSFSFPFVYLFVVYAPEIIYIYAGKGYEGAIIPMQISMPLMIVIGYEQIIINQGLLPLDKNKAVLTNAIIGAITGVLFSFLLVGTYKSIGSVIVWILSEFLVLISASIFIKRYAHFIFPFSLLIKEFFIYIPLLFILIICHQNSLTPFLSVLTAGILTSVYTIVVQRFVLKQPELVYFSNKVYYLVNRLKRKK